MEIVGFGLNGDILIRGGNGREVWEFGDFRGHGDVMSQLRLLV